MAMGHKQPLQPQLFIPHAQLPQSAGHPFYQALDRALTQAGFDAFVESVCQSAYAAPMGLPIATPMGTELRPTPKDADKPSDPKVCAPLLYPTVEERQRQPDSTGRDRREKAHDADLRAAGDASRFFSTHCLPVAVARFATGLWHKPALTTLPRST